MSHITGLTRLAASKKLIDLVIPGEVYWRNPERLVERTRVQLQLSWIPAKNLPE
ncbi:MAG: hypothetical protein M3Y56_02205 [Armatimonadota bacterium]|nr:hypothetical protein [Armatimonadota bacterium]